MVSGKSPFLRIDGVEASVMSLREQVARSPDDMSARLDLAWGLLLLAIYQVALDANFDVAALHDRPIASDSLLVELLKQLAIVSKLDGGADQEPEIRRMRSLVSACGAAEQLQQVEKLVARSEEAIVRSVHPFPRTR
jgi:hypothetical protein